MKKHRRIFIVILSFLLFCSCSLPSFAAALPMSDAYKSGKFYGNLISAVRTGYQRADVASVAMSQLGYHEGASPDDFDGLNTSSSLNYTEYNYLYGSLDGYGYAWCATFVSWCLRQAGVAENIAPSHCNCAAWVKKFRSMSRFKDSGTYAPKTGDIIFFKARGGDSVSGHVGIVLYVRNNYVYTIEGNTSDAVKQQRYLLTNSTILGYGVPDYPETANVNGDIYIVSTNDVGSTLALRSEKSVSDGSTLLSLKSGQIVEVSEISDGWAKISFGGKTGWASLSYLSLVKRGEVKVTDVHKHSYSKSIILPSCTESGYTLYRCSCGESYKSDVKAALGHNFTNGKCTVCQTSDPSYIPPKTNVSEQIKPSDTVTAKPTEPTKIPQIKEPPKAKQENKTEVVPEEPETEENENSNVSGGETDDEPEILPPESENSGENKNLSSDEAENETSASDAVTENKDGGVSDSKDESQSYNREKEMLFVWVSIFVIALWILFLILFYIVRKKRKK